jgi:hypothetical protein
MGTSKGEEAVWIDYRPHTYLGLTVPKFPNMFTRPSGTWRGMRVVRLSVGGAVN